MAQQEFSNPAIIDLFKRYALRPGEQITEVTSWPDSVGGMIETGSRLLFFRDDRELLLIGREPWATGVAVFEREDVVLPGRRETDVVVVADDGQEYHLNDAATVAELGRLVYQAKLAPTSYAQILTSYHPWTTAPHTLIDRPDFLSAHLGILEGPEVEPLRVTADGDGIGLTFYSAALRWTTFGTSAYCTVYRWQVDIPASHEATWERRTVASGLDMTGVRTAAAAPRDDSVA